MICGEEWGFLGDFSGEMCLVLDVGGRLGKEHCGE